MVKFKPVIKWSGSKRSQSEKILAQIPNKEYNTYYEPFVGGASMLYQIARSELVINKYVCSDINSDLINLWNEIKNNPCDVVRAYTEHFNKLTSYSTIQDKRAYFEHVRAKFNQDKSSLDFMFIMRTTTNGMPRYNKSGEFNNSYHLNRNGINPKELNKIVEDWNSLLNSKNIIFEQKSYNEIITQESDLMYLDPPYPNSSAMYSGDIDLNLFFSWLKNQESFYMMSMSGKTQTIDKTYSVPKELFSKHLYLDSGNSSFRRLYGKSNKEYVKESLYIK